MKKPSYHGLCAAALGIGVLVASAVPLAAQAEFPDLAALVSRAREANPEIQAAQERVAAARARLEAAGAPPDPRLGVGLVNALVSDPLSSEDFMTMRMVQLGQLFPFPGKLGLEREAARWELAAAQAESLVVEREVVAAVQRAYYELYFLDRAAEIVEHNRQLLGDFAAVTEARYRVGTGVQPDVLKAQVETTRLGNELLALADRRAAIRAELNALVDRPSTEPVERPALPALIERAAVPAPGLAVRFTAVALEPAAGEAGPIPSLAELQALVVRHNPHLAAHGARIEAQRARAALAGKAALPDLDISVGYGQRGGREDMVTAMVSIPVPLFKGRKQDALATAEKAQLAELVAERHALSNDLHAEVAALHASLLRTREKIALAREGILPQARAALEAAVAGYPVATVDFLTLLDNQVTLFRHELDYVRLLADFGRDLAELERVAGTEVLE